MRYIEILEALDATKAASWATLSQKIIQHANDPHLYAYLENWLYQYLRARNLANPGSKDERWYQSLLRDCAIHLNAAFPGVWGFIKESSWVRAYMNGGKIGDRPAKTYLTFADPVQGLSHLPMFLEGLARALPQQPLQVKLHAQLADFYQDVDNVVIHYPAIANIGNAVTKLATDAGIQLAERSSLHRSQHGRDTAAESDTQIVVNGIIANLKAYPQWQQVAVKNPQSAVQWLDQLINHHVTNAAHRNVA